LDRCDEGVGVEEGERVAPETLYPGADAEKCAEEVGGDGAASSFAGAVDLALDGVVEVIGVSLGAHRTEVRATGGHGSLRGCGAYDRA
jgi:hypothetical protein